MVMSTMTIYLQYLLCLFLASNSGKLFVSPLIDPHTATLMDDDDEKGVVGDGVKQNW